MSVSFHQISEEGVCDCLVQKLSSMSLIGVISCPQSIAFKSKAITVTWKGNIIIAPFIPCLKCFYAQP